MTAHHTLARVVWIFVLSGCAKGMNQWPRESDGSEHSPAGAGGSGGMREMQTETSGSAPIGGGTLIDVSAATEDPCKVDPTREQCQLVPSGPACGDGHNNQPTESCDDGNSVPGDGCSGVCTVEKYFECPPEGPCRSTIVCGDGVIGPGEACDDGNAVSGDGCSATCNLVEKGFVCRAPGQSCIRVYLCGDGVTDPNEGCDDANSQAGDGCDHCKVEPGYKCAGTPSVCSASVCGDGKVEGAESCDDGNALPLDGCSATCQAEPNCKSGACSSTCGDGIVLGEACDDGNLRDGDGCSSQCTIEPGYTCTTNPGCTATDGSCTLTVPARFRDFVADGQEFEPGGDKQVATLGLVKPQLDPDGKPVYSGVTGGAITSATTFAQWYRDTANRNKSFAGSIQLFDNGKGGFVNRWGPNGEQWKGYLEAETPMDANTLSPFCGNAGTMCGGTCTIGPTQTECLDTCDPLGASGYDCWATPVYFDGNPVFFPLDHLPGTLQESTYTAQIPPAYGWNWRPEPGGALHNFHFTTEVRYWFSYDANTTASLDFTGDDDVWVFVNRTLAVDLGGWHPPLSGSVTIDGTTAGKFGLAPGNVYEIAVFHAERKTKGSSFRLTLSGFNLSPSTCVTNCGDGVVASGDEQCDDGAANNTGDYGKCSPDCTLGPRCGDAIIQTEYGEACDDGVNDNSYGGCSPTCELGPHCGDSLVQTESGEQCDDGVNDGSYGTCSSGCVRAPYCGDGKLQLSYEECDDGNNSDHDGCSAACKLEIAPAK
jgi:fibro-slime domain-containing protein